MERGEPLAGPELRRVPLRGGGDPRDLASDRLATVTADRGSGTFPTGYLILNVTDVGRTGGRRRRIPYAAGSFRVAGNGVKPELLTLAGEVDDRAAWQASFGSMFQTAGTR
jgi:hypothetical protein